MVTERPFEFDRQPHNKATYIDAKKLSNLINNESQVYLFLDIDGTLADFTIDPKDSFIPKSTLSLLHSIQNMGVTVVMITGRSLQEAKRMVSPLKVPIAATHGLEIELSATAVNHIQTLKPSFNRPELNHIKQSLFKTCKPYPTLRIENKPYSCALHYRTAPALANIAHDLISKAIKAYPNWTLKQGKYVWEAVPKGVNKGSAILTILQKLRPNDYKYNKFATAIFIGDDITDEAGFAAINSLNKNKSSKDNFDINSINSDGINILTSSTIQGVSIKVGNDPTCASFYVNDMAEVTDLLSSFLKLINEPRQSISL